MYMDQWMREVILWNYLFMNRMTNGTTMIITMSVIKNI